MSIRIEQIVNEPISSNCFVVYDKTVGDDCFIIDPGFEDPRKLESLLKARCLTPKFILLTHEHFDHSWGCNFIQKKYKIPILCSELCAQRVRNHKTNFSVFFNPYKSFDINGNIIVVHDMEILNFANHEIEILYTPGHTDSSICIRLDQNIFTGDTLIKGLKTVTKLPGGSKEKTKESLAYIKSLTKVTDIYPGHGNSFKMKEFLEDKEYKYC